MADTRTFVTTPGRVEFGCFGDLGQGDLFIPVDTDDKDVSKLMETLYDSPVWMKTGIRRSEGGGVAVDLDCGVTKSYRADQRLVAMSQRNMWEVWA